MKLATSVANAIASFLGRDVAQGLDATLPANGLLAETTGVAFTAYGGPNFNGTITNAPSMGNPTKWIQINDNGVTRYVPSW